MNGRNHRLLLFIASALLAGGPARAHDFWLEPSSFSPTPGAEVAVTVLVGERFHGETLPRPEPRIRRFVLLDERGETPLGGAPGAEPAGRAKVGAAGYAVAGYVGYPSSITLEAQKFEAYLIEEGLERIVAARASSGRSSEPGREHYSRCAKSLLRVGGSGETGFDRSLGCDFELVPERLPGAGAREVLVRATHAGKPVAGIKVFALRRDPDHSVSTRTDAQGRATLALDRGGAWLVKAVHMIAAEDRSGADWQSFWASITFEAPAPASSAASPCACTEASIRCGCDSRASSRRPVHVEGHPTPRPRYDPPHGVRLLGLEGPADRR